MSRLHEPPPPRTRHMMKLWNRGEVAVLSTAHCPLCDRTGVIEHTVHGAPLRMCPFCMASWRPQDPEAV